MTVFESCSRNFDPSRNMALVNRGYLEYEMEKLFKVLFLWNPWSDFKIISLRCSLNDLFKNLILKFPSVKKHGPVEWGPLALYGHEEILNNSSSLKLLRFWNKLSEMFLGRPFSKLFPKVWSPRHVVLVNGATCVNIDMNKFLENSFSLKPLLAFEIISHIDVAWMTLSKTAILICQ